MEAAYNQASGADGVKIAVLRKGCANLKFIWAAAHRRNMHYVAIILEN